MNGGPVLALGVHVVPLSWHINTRAIVEQPLVAAYFIPLHHKVAALTCYFSFIAHQV